jgi:RHS repeat-associated protein
LGYKVYELKDHLGNIRATLSDVRMSTITPTGIGDFHPDVLSMTDYYAFGMEMVGRVYNKGGYRYGFNGKENTNEAQGVGNFQDYGMRDYDPRICRFIKVDPITAEYPMLTPYQFASNTPIQGVDIDGLEVAYAQYGIRGGVPALPTFIGIAGSFSVGVAFDTHGNMAPFYSYSVGGQAGGYIGTGLNVGINFQTPTVNEFSGSGVNVGFTFSMIGKGFGVAVGGSAKSEDQQTSDSNPLNDYMWGINVDLPLTGPGIGLTGFIEHTGTEYPLGTINLIEVPSDVLQQTLQEWNDAKKIFKEMYGFTIDMEINEKFVNEVFQKASEEMQSFENQIIITPE